MSGLLSPKAPVRRRIVDCPTQVIEAYRVPVLVSYKLRPRTEPDLDLRLSAGISQIRNKPACAAD